ncbi:MAG: Tn3 family transposase [Cyanobacteria bacterium CRU_2_1]|nr:Tn3 family transposase [Leptolyngbyaceae cyanobacterium RU_5_1]NJR63350.1 Tn3 family transposase [Cyanobacteria bacterium CRU_2_1]
MTTLERTAYPTFKIAPTPKELAEQYTPTASEVAFAQAQTRSKSGQLSVLVMLKAFQRLGYFPALSDLPSILIQHLRACLNLRDHIAAQPSLRSLRHYQVAIRRYLEIKPYDQNAQVYLRDYVATAALTKDHPADLINVAVELLVKERYELPAFSTLDHLVSNIRSTTNNRLFQTISDGLSTAEQTYLDQLLLSETPETQASLNLLKSTPKSATFAHLTQLQTKFNQLMTFGDANRLLQELPSTKRQSFAAQAKALDSAELRQHQPQKRRTLLLCLLYQAQVQTRDHLVEMFLKRMQRIKQQAKARLVELRESHLSQTQTLLEQYAKVLTVAVAPQSATTLGEQVQAVLEHHGGAKQLLQQCEEIANYNSDNYRPLLWRFYRHYRKQLFQLVRSLDIRSTSQDQSLVEAVQFILGQEHRRSQWLPAVLDLSFISNLWRQLVVDEVGASQRLARQPLEVCIFTYLALDLKTGDACVIGSESYADFREQLLSWHECEPQLAQYCAELSLPSKAHQFVAALRTQLTQTAQQVDQACQASEQFNLSSQGVPVLQRIKALPKPPGADTLEAAIWEKLPERSILDILCNTEHWLHWTRHFGPASGSEPKLEQPMERYILTTFGYGCNLGPNQTARHTRGLVTSHMLSYTNRRHVDVAKLEAAIRDLIGAYNQLNLPKVWGTGKTAAADGSKFTIYENNLISEYHIRYGGYGGIAYHHVSDMYIALFTHFITCGVWEAVYILDGLLKNTSEIQPDILHADTQGQSTPVFGLSYLLGIKLMPRIRNWQDLTFLKPTQDELYPYLEPLFKGTADWALIETHWQDMIRVALSIRAGKVLPSTLLRKLGSYSRRNRLYQAFQALGLVIRTLFLLRYISDAGLRRQITACTNIVEDYNRFVDWLFFGKQGVITDNDPQEQEKRLKYLDLVANAVILQNTVDISLAIQTLSAEGIKIDRAALKTVSPYITRHLKRYGDYVIDFKQIPLPLEEAILLPIQLDEQQLE